jgi:hypothetical protein
MSELATCPHCKVSLQGAVIPEASRHWYGTATYYRREIGVEIPSVYDGMLYFQCPDCGGCWHRFPVGHYLRERAEPYVTVKQQGAA